MRKYLLIVFFGFGFIISFSQTATHVVISEIYGGGGNSGATYKNDFIELYNPTSSPVSLVGWSVQYASSSGTTWAVTNLSGSIAPKSYYLIQEAAGTGGTTSLPTPDATGTTNMSGTTGKVALVSSTTALTGASPSSASIVDLVGFGTATFFEGTVGPAPSNTTSIERKANSSSTSTSMQSGGADELLGNGYDSDNNSADFVTRSPQPQNTSSAIEPDATAPSFTSSYPKTQNIGATSFEAVVNLTKPGTVYVGVYTEGGASSAQIKAGQDKYGNPLPDNLKKTINVTAAGTDFITSISGVSPSTFYYVYFLAENEYGSYPASTGVTTLNSSDATPPNFVSSYPKIDPVNPTGFTLKAELDELGKTYFVVLGAGASAPTADQVKNGQDASGVDVTSDLAGLINVTTANTEFTNEVSELNTETAYDVYVVAEDNIPNLQISPIKISISTGAQFTEDFETCDSNSFVSYSVSGAQTWGCVSFGYNASKGYRMNGFSGGAVANEDWLISPVINLNSAASLSFYSQFSFAGNSLKLKISSDYSGSGDPNAATWSDLNGGFPSVAVSSSSTAAADWTLSNVDLSAYSGKVHIAFVYTSTSSAAARWTIDNIAVNNAKASYLQVSPSALTFSANNSTKNYTLKGFNLTNDVSVSSTSKFLISKDNVNFSSAVSYSATEGMAQPTIYVKFSVDGISKDTYTASILNSSSGVDSKTVATIGTDKSQTLNIATYNLEFFGTDVKDASNVEFGPTDDALQVSNVTTVMQTLASDVFAVEEISDDNAFNQLVSNLAGYDKVVSGRWSYSWQAPDPNYPPQKTGFIYNTSRVQLVSSRVMFATMYDSIIAGTKMLPNYPSGTSSSFWASGRLPFMATFDVTINGITRRIRVIDIHAKSGSDQPSYDRRAYDANVLRDSLNAHYKHDNVVLVGDFNDDVYGSITSGQQSSYQPFVGDANNFNVLTYALNQSGASTYPSSASFIDNMIVSNQFANAYVTNSVTVEDPRGYINNYSTTTSDHLPVSARFLLSNKDDQTISFSAIQSKIFGDAAFTLSATASSGLIVAYTSSDPSVVSINGKTVTILKAGTVSITAHQPGNADYNGATDVVQSFTVVKANQAITFNSLANKTLGDDAFNVSATSTSGLAISFATTSDKIALSGTQVTLVKAGRATITASQAGDGNYNTATSIDQSFCINPTKPTITITNANSISPTLVSSSTTGNQWYFNGTAITGATGNSITVTNQGTYKVQAVADDCISEFSNDAVVTITEVDEQPQNIFIYPNPVEDYLFISGIEDAQQFFVVDFTGKSSSVAAEKQGDGYHLYVKEFSSGVYVLRMSENNVIRVFKFAKK